MDPTATPTASPTPAPTATPTPAPTVNLCLGVVCTQQTCRTTPACDITDGQCKDDLVTDGTTCNDGDVGTANDMCQTGVCQGTDRCQGVTCPASATCQTSNGCARETGTCSFSNVVDGTSCDDGFVDTVNDLCSSGACVGTDPCSGVTCNPSSGCVTSACARQQVSPFGSSCVETNKADGSACEDALGEATTDSCSAGVCVGVAVAPQITAGLADLSVQYGAQLLLFVGVNFGVTHRWTVDGVAASSGDDSLSLQINYATSTFAVAFTSTSSGGSASSSATVTVAAPSSSDTPPVGTEYITIGVTLTGVVDEATISTIALTTCIASVAEAQNGPGDTITLDTSRSDPNVFVTTIRQRFAVADITAKSTALGTLVNGNGGNDFVGLVSDCLFPSASRASLFQLDLVPPPTVTPTVTPAVAPTAAPTAVLTDSPTAAPTTCADGSQLCCFEPSVAGYPTVFVHRIEDVRGDEAGGVHACAARCRANTDCRTFVHRPADAPLNLDNVCMIQTAAPSSLELAVSQGWQRRFNVYAAKSECAETPASGAVMACFEPAVPGYRTVFTSDLRKVLGAVVRAVEDCAELCKADTRCHGFNYGTAVATANAQASCNTVSTTSAALELQTNRGWQSRFSFYNLRSECSATPAAVLCFGTPAPGYINWDKSSMNVVGNPAGFGGTAAGCGAQCRANTQCRSFTFRADLGAGKPAACLLFDTESTNLAVLSNLAWHRTYAIYDELVSCDLSN